jgi:hypothetical protein
VTANDDAATDIRSDTLLSPPRKFANTTRKPLQALAQQTSFPVREGADLSSGAQNDADEANRCSSLQKSSFQARRSIPTDSVSTSLPPERDKFLAKSTKSSQMKSGESDSEPESTAVALSSPQTEWRRFCHSVHLKSAQLSRWMDVYSSYRFLKRRQEVIRTWMINHVEIYMKLACAQRDYHNILGIINVLQAVEQGLKEHFNTTSAQFDVLLLVKDGQIQYPEFAAHLLHHLRKTIRFKPDVSSTTLILQGKFNLECLELLSSLPKIADRAHDLKLKNQLEQQHRVRPLKPGDHVDLYPPESTFASGTYLEVRLQLPKIWRAAWINTNSGSVKTSPSTHQKNQPTGSAPSASTSLGPNKALTDFFSKYRKVRTILSVKPCSRKDFAVSLDPGKISYDLPTC